MPLTKGDVLGGIDEKMVSALAAITKANIATEIWPKPRKIIIEVMLRFLTRHKISYRRLE